MLSKVRLLVLALAALCAAGVVANTALAASKPAKAKRCAAGKVRVVADGACIKVAAPRAGAVAEAPAALRRDAGFRRLAGARAAKRADALVKAGRRLSTQAAEGPPAKTAKAARRAGVRARTAAAAP